MTEESDHTFILARFQDAHRAAALRALLESEGIAVSTPGLQHRLLWGFVAGYIEVLVRVRTADRERAERVHEVFLTPASDKEIAALGGEASRTDRLRRIAAFVAVVLTFGCGHFYARRWRVGWMLLVTEVLCIGLALVWPPFAFAIAGIVLADAACSVQWIGADQRGERPGALARSAPVLAVLAIALVPALRGAAPTLFAGRSMVAACRRVAQCEGLESVDACVARAADTTFSGRGSREREHACAECLDESRCEDIAFDCAECGGLVVLPTPEPVDRTPGPAGTSADDMQLVIPDLFDRRHADPAEAERLEDLMRTLDDRRTAP